MFVLFSMVFMLLSLFPCLVFVSWGCILCVRLVFPVCFAVCFCCQCLFCLSCVNGLFNVCCLCLCALLVGGPCLFCCFLVCSRVLS